MSEAKMGDSSPAVATLGDLMGLTNEPDVEAIRERWDASEFYWRCRPRSTEWGLIDWLARDVPVLLDALAVARRGGR